MTNKIQKIIEKYPHPDQKLLPNIWLTWNTNAGQTFLNCKTGVTTKTPIKNYGSIGWSCMKNDIICVNAGATLKYAYCKYHTVAKLVEFSVVTMSSNRTGGARLWEYAEEGERYFVDIDKNIYTVDGKKDPDGLFYAYKGHNTYRFDLYLSILYRCNYNDKIMNEFKKFIGGDTIIVGNGRCLTLDHFWYIQTWYKTKKYKESSGKVQQLLNKITALPHADISDICQKFEPISYTSSGSSWKRTIKDVIYFEHLNDEWSVLRFCTRTYGNGNVESYRIYISEDGDCKITKLNDCGKWIPAQAQRGYWQPSYGRIVNFDDMAKCKRLSYVMPIIKNISIEKQASTIAHLIKYPQIEKLCKMGYDNLAMILLSDGTPNANMKEKFGELNKKAKTIFGEFGLNKRQLDIWIQYCNRPYTGQRISGNYFQTCIPSIKKYFGNDLSSIDDETFDKLLQCVAHIKYSHWYGVDKLVEDIRVDGKVFLKNIVRLCEKYEDSDEIIRLIGDSVSAYRRVNPVDRPEINWIFKERSDLVRVHDALVEIRRIQDEENRLRCSLAEAERRKKEDEKRKKVDEKRKCYEYEDDNYVIRLPESVKEIVEEGVKQHICIGGYTGRHSDGNTNLFFLRSKESPNTPFYAIEMNNDKKIVQIHGFGNKWLGNDPAAIPTVIRWLRKNEINCDKKILTCTAKGYGGGAPCIEMPVVD